MIGQLNSTEEAILDRALIETYRMKGITTDPETQATKEPPVMEDLYKVLLGGSEPESRSMADRLEKFIKGSMAGIFDSQSNINLESSMTVFSTKNLEEALRPIAFYMILDFVWTTIRRELRKRILIVEEAWYLMQNNDSARFIYGIAKRARKYYLGLTTISQDVDDFLTSEYGKAVVTNSSIQMLFKQHPAAIDKVVDTFYLSEGEKRFLLSAGVGEGLFFAGANHVAIRVVASESEHNLITTNPEEILKLREERRKQENKEGVQIDLNRNNQMVYRQYKPPEPMDEYTTFDEKGEVKPDYDAETISNRKEHSDRENVNTTGDSSQSKGMVNKKSSVENAGKEEFVQVNQKVESSMNPPSNVSDAGSPKNKETKKNLDTRVIELRKKMLQDSDSFMSGTPSAEEILESVEEMKKENQRSNKINTSNNQTNKPTDIIRGFRENNSRSEDVNGGEANGSSPTNKSEDLSGSNGQINL